MKETIVKKQENQHFISVFVRKLPWDTSKRVASIERQSYIDSCSNDRVRNQRLFVWKLLEEAIEQSLGMDPHNIVFHSDDGRWWCEEFCFSLSHTGDIVAVALSDTPVGIDIEYRNNDKFDRISVDRICIDSELIDGVDIPSLWTAKEALFKKSYRKIFRPREINTTQQFNACYDLSIGDQKLIMCVASDNKAQVEIVLNDDIVSNGYLHWS